MTPDIHLPPPTLANGEFGRSGPPPIRANGEFGRSGGPLWLRNSPFAVVEAVEAAAAAGVAV
jgi:hypothetical protein